MSTNICRLCLTDQTVIYNIFEYNIKELPKQIFRCTAVEILKDDGLPNAACMNCIQMIIQFDLFRKQCQFSDSVIKKNYKKQAVKSEDIIEQKHETECTVINNESTKINTNLKIFDQEIQERNLRNNKSVNNGFPEKIESNEFKISDEMVMEYCSDDDNISNHSESMNDPDYNPSSDGVNCTSDYTMLLSKTTTFGRKKCKIKIKQEKGSGRHHLIYSEQDYAILGRERKVRIYEIDDTMREIIGENIYTCDICLQNFTSFFDYYDHQEVHNGQLVFKCSKCNEIFLSRQKLVEHDARHKIPCKICELEVLPKSMSAHLLIHTDIHKCPDCGMRHTSNASLEKHIKARHTGIKGFVCHVCGKQSSCQSSMNRHMAYHSTERPYKCKYCDFCAKSLNIVQVHTSRKHFAEKCVCEICAKIFKSQPSLIQHMKRIHTARKHICDICGKAFIERYNLNRHLKKHAGQRLHECKLCHKEFFTIRKLKEHMHSHRQGCVNCPKCGKEFFYKKYYNKHVLKCTKFEDFNGVITDANNCIPLISH